MALGRKRLRRIQLGLEVTPGTAVVETTRWRGEGAIEDQTAVETVAEDIGLLGGADRTNIPKVMGALALADTPATFEQFPILMAMAFGGPTSGSADGAGTDFIYQTTIPTTAAPTIRTSTLVGGDDAEQERMAYVHATKVTLKGAAGEASKMGGTLAGRQVARYATGFAAASIPAVEDALTSRGRVYLDAIGGAYGTTQLQAVILGYEINFGAMWIPKFTMDGELYFTMAVYTDHEITGKLTVEHDTAAQGATGLKADWRAQTPRLLRIDITGNAVASAGTAYTNKHIIVDLPIKITKVGALEDKNGNSIVTADFVSKYNVTAGNAGKVIVVNEKATLFS